VYGTLTLNAIKDYFEILILISPFLHIRKAAGLGVVLDDRTLTHRVEEEGVPRPGPPGHAVDAPAVLAAAEGGLLAPLLQHLHPAHLTLVSAEGQQALSVMNECMKAGHYYSIVITSVTH
jgi:hypothetical protein